jgi:hypothetical protein
VCNVSSLAFGARSLECSEIAGRRVLEVGSLDVNGGLRSVLEHYGPAEYVGVVVITTRSPGFPFHGYPHDYWRFTPGDFRAIFSDCDIEALEDDGTAPGVFLSAVKSGEFVPADLSEIAIHSVVTNSPARELEPMDFRSASYLVAVARWRVFARARAFGRRIFRWHAS